MIFKEQLSKIHDLEYVVKVVTVYQNQKDVWIFAPKNSWKVNDVLVEIVSNAKLYIF